MEETAINEELDVFIEWIETSLIECECVFKRFLSQG